MLSFTTVKVDAAMLKTLGMRRRLRTGNTFHAYLPPPDINNVINDCKHKNTCDL